MNISLTMGDEDFAQLCEDSAWLSTLDRTKVADRLHLVGDVNAHPSLHWKVIYWLGHSWASVMLVRAFFQSMGHEFEFVEDEGMRPNGVSIGLAVLTDYECPADRQITEGQPAY